MKCSKCSAPAEDNSRYCTRCGSLLRRDEGPTVALGTWDVDTPAHGDALVHLTAGDAVLIASGGLYSGVTYTLAKDETVIGRDRQADILLNDITVSRRNSLISRRGDRFYVRDLNALNGTLVNRERIAQEQRLQSGDEVRVGKFSLLFLQAPAD